jgi:hypothetical protein
MNIRYYKRILEIFNTFAGVVLNSIVKGKDSLIICLLLDTDLTLNA